MRNWEIIKSHPALQRFGSDRSSMIPNAVSKGSVAKLSQRLGWRRHHQAETMCGPGMFLASWRGLTLDYMRHHFLSAGKSGTMI